MALEQSFQHRIEKRRLFEYFVVQLDRWKTELSTKNSLPFSKLQLQKLLFLISAHEATLQCHPMLDIFDRFYALKYGPVEMDVYEAMSNPGSFVALNFGERFCKIHNENIGFFDTISVEQKAIVDNAINSLKNKEPEYILKDPFKLVEITHGWTAWQIAMIMAGMSNSKMERMSTSDICNSTQKLF